MSTTERLLLTTKIQPPRIRTTLVARPQLLAQLDQASQHQLTLISAPAGSGKTTLLSDWLARCSTPFAWVALDEDDNDPVRFLSYCIAALRTLFPQIGTTAMDLLHMQEALEPVLITLINELITLQKNDMLLILDDYHLIHNQTIQHAMSFLLEHLPTTLHLVIASRVDPPLPLARLRARGELNELRLTDLRFTPAETASFCQKVMGLQLDPEHIATLEERTEGWIASLQLETLSLRGRQSKAEIATFVRSFSGRDRYVLDYLLEEVLHQQPAYCQEFLLNTSLLERLSPALCTAVHDQQEAPLLEELEQAKRGIELCQQWGHTRHLLDGYLILATIQQARGDYSAAHTTLTQAKAPIEQEQQASIRPNQALNWMNWQLAEAYAHLWLRQGKLVQVEQWLQEQQLTSESSIPHPGTIIRARLLLAQQKSAQARGLLETLVPSAQQAGEVSLEYSLSAMLALALHIQGEDKAAIAQLVPVLERAEAENFVRTFIDLGPSIQALLRLASAQDNVTHYANRLLSAFAETARTKTEAELTEH